MNLPLILETLTTIALSAYFVLLTFSFFKFRLERKKEELSALTESLNLSKFTFNVHQRFDKEFAKIDYLLPVGFVTILTFIGLFILLLGQVFYGDEASTGPVKSILWSGSDFWVGSEYNTEKRNLAIVAWALLGGYLNGAQYIYRRFATIDLTPGNFYSVGIRMVFAMVISLMLSYFIVADDSTSSHLMLVVAFLTGMFPERGLKILMSKVSTIFPKESDQEVENIPLQAIEGISYFHKLRLNEVGIDNVQNLANFDFLLLTVKTPFPLRVLVDWVAQAKLFMEFREDTPLLQKAGIRSAMDYLDAIKGHEDRLQRIHEVTGVDLLKLEINYKNLEEDKSLWLLTEIRESRFRIQNISESVLD